MNTIVRLVKLPMTIRGMIVSDPDGNYNVYINKNMSHEIQRLTYRHESEHIISGDLYSEESVMTLESRAKYKTGL